MIMETLQLYVYSNNHGRKLMQLSRSELREEQLRSLYGIYWTDMQQQRLERFENSLVMAFLRSCRSVISVFYDLTGNIRTSVDL